MLTYLRTFFLQSVQDRAPPQLKVFLWLSLLAFVRQDYLLENCFGERWSRRLRVFLCIIFVFFKVASIIFVGIKVYDIITNPNSSVCVMCGIYDILSCSAIEIGITKNMQ